MSMRWKGVDEMRNEVGLLVQVMDHILCNPEDGPWRDDEQKGRPFDPKVEYCCGIERHGKKTI
jgi:hypothetical protein